MRGPELRMPVVLSGSTAETWAISPRGSLRRTRRRGFDRSGQGVLFADKAGDEAAAPNGAPRFEAAQRPEHVAPRESQALPDHQVAEHDAPARQELLGDGFAEVFAICGGRGGQERPAPRRPAAGRPAPALRSDRRPGRLPLGAAPLGEPARGQETPHGLKAIGVEEAPSDEVPKAFFDLDRQPARHGEELGVEAGSALAEEGE